MLVMAGGVASRRRGPERIGAYGLAVRWRAGKIYLSGGHGGNFPLRRRAVRLCESGSLSIAGTVLALRDHRASSPASGAAPLAPGMQSSVDGSPRGGKECRMV
jgi:hypothetical protein